MDSFQTREHTGFFGRIVESIKGVLVGLLLGAGLLLLALLLGSGLASTTVAIAWIVYQPLLGGLLLAAGFGLFILPFTVGRRARTRRA